MTDTPEAGSRTADKLRYEQYERSLSRYEKLLAAREGELRFVKKPVISFRVAFAAVFLAGSAWAADMMFNEVGFTDYATLHQITLSEPAIFNNPKVAQMMTEFLADAKLTKLEYRAINQELEQYLPASRSKIALLKQLPKPKPVAHSG